MRLYACCCNVVSGQKCDVNYLDWIFIICLVIFQLKVHVYTCTCRSGDRAVKLSIVVMSKRAGEYFLR